MSKACGLWPTEAKSSSLRQPDSILLAAIFDFEFVYVFWR